MRLRYYKARAVDGDTLRVVLKGAPKILMVKYVRIIGIDTEELSDTNNRKRIKAIQAKEECHRWLKSFIKPRLFAVECKSHEGDPYLKNHNGRILCRMMIWKWTKMKWVDYADHIIDKKLHKRESKWNKQP